MAARTGHGAAPAGGERGAEDGAIEDSTSEGREQDVPHGRDQEPHAPSPRRGEWDYRDAREQFDVHIKEKTPEEKSASSLKEVAREAMKAASAGALSVIGAAWKAQKTASSWNQAQGTLAKVPQVLRRRENRQTGEGPGQRERGVAIESHP